MDTKINDNLVEKLIKLQDEKIERVKLITLYEQQLQRLKDLNIIIDNKVIELTEILVSRGINI